MDKLARAVKDQFALLEDMNRRVWEGQIFLAILAHALGGMGLGLLAYRALARRAGLVGFILLGVSALIHLYAYMTPRAGRRERWPSALERRS